MAKQKTFEDFFVDELKDLYSAEKQITKALPKMIKAANSEDLKNAFQTHLEETEKQIERLDEIGETLGKKLTGKKCAAMEGLTEEAKELMEEEMEPEVLDVALICAAQKVEHYEIASYGCALTYAGLLEQPEIAELLNETLEEEKNTDEILSGLAENINAEAVKAGEGEDEEEGNENSGSSKNGSSRSSSRKGSSSNGSGSNGKSNASGKSSKKKSTSKA